MERSGERVRDILCSKPHSKMCRTQIFPLDKGEQNMVKCSETKQKKRTQYMPNRDRLLLLLHTLQENTDDESWLTTAELIRVLNNEGFECSIRSLRKDIRSLQNSGFDIAVRETEGRPTVYSWQDREWSRPELQILIDAVDAAQFIPQERSRKLISKLSTMAGPSHKEELKPQILISERIKAKNRNMIYSVQAIRKAIDRDKKISFRYLQYTSEKQQVPKHEGTEEEYYIVSPYATVWNNDRYYLVGWSDKREKVTVFRIDRMEVPKQLQKKRVSAPDDFDVRDYTDKIFKMYDGPDEEVTLQCGLGILDQVIDRFGEGIEIRLMKRKKCFEVTVPVSVSGTFYAWVFQYAGEMKIVGPEWVKDGYLERLKGAVDEAASN